MSEEHVVQAAPPVLHCRNLSKRYVEGKIAVEVLRNVEFSVQPGELVAIIGSSGSGKSTLLNMLGGLDKPSQGEVLIDGQDLAKLGEAQRGTLRNKKLGFIYQFHHLLPDFTALENVCMPLLIAGVSPVDARARASELLDKVGLGARLEHKPGELSGGERQRAAVVRALVTNPRCVLADEPTGNLDPRTAHTVYEQMLALNVALNTSIIVVTHDPNLARKMNKVWRIEDGCLVPTEL